VGLLQSPSELDPSCFPEQARKRRDFVLAELRGAGLLNDAQLASGTAEAMSSALQPAAGCPD
jgi:membrane peptidoglycan carboxypeptidase